MPAVYAHYTFGLKVLNALPKSLTENILRFREAFELGTQGPDILFYHHPIKKNSIRQKGSDMHFVSAESFFVRQAKRLTHEGHVAFEQDVPSLLSAEAAYVAGFLCHFALDVFAHPTVYELQATGISHGKIESEFDKYLLRKDGRSIRGCNTARFATDAHGVVLACANVLDIKPEEAELAIKTMRKINGWFGNRFETFHAFAHAVLKLGGMDRKFGDMFLRKKDDTRCAECNLRLENALQTAVDFTAALAEEYFSRLRTIAQGEKLNNFFEHDYTGENLS